jgi:acetyl-CoA C-acetyltransferase
MDDIGLWELNEAFAVQTVYCRDRLGIPNDRFNVDGGAISIGHPYGMSGNRLCSACAGRRASAGSEVRGCDHVRRRRHGRGGPV